MRIVARAAPAFLCALMVDDCGLAGDLAGTQGKAAAFASAFEEELGTKRLVGRDMQTGTLTDLTVTFRGCRARVRFDDEEAQTCSAAGPSDNRTEVSFLQNDSRFVKHMLRASRGRISAEVFQEESPLFDLDVRGFEPSRHRPRA